MQARTGRRVKSRQLLSGPMVKPQVLQVTGPIVLDWGNGMRLQISPVGVAVAAPSPTGEKRQRRGGRKATPSTQALISQMQADHAAGKAGSTAHYTAWLMAKEPGKSEGAASQIVRREAKRIFGKSLGRSKKAKAGKPGRKASPATGVLREKLAHDKAAGELRDASHYLRWLMDQKGHGLGLKGARPIVYRELRAVR